MFIFFSGRASLSTAMEYVEDYLRRCYRGPWINRPMCRNRNPVDYDGADEHASVGHYGTINNWITLEVEESTWWKKLGICSQSEIIKNEIPAFVHAP